MSKQLSMNDRKFFIFPLSQMLLRKPLNNGKMSVKSLKSTHVFPPQLHLRLILRNLQGFLNGWYH